MEKDPCRGVVYITKPG